MKTKNIVDFSVTVDDLQVTHYVNNISISDQEISPKTGKLEIEFTADRDEVLEHMIRYEIDEKALAADWISDDIIKSEYERRGL